jgi:hypothetical protein
MRAMKKTVLYATPPRRFGRLEWRLEVWDAEDGGRKIVPTWRTLSNARWSLPAEHAGEWPKGLFQLCADHVSALAAAVEGRS